MRARCPSCWCSGRDRRSASRAVRRARRAGCPAARGPDRAAPGGIRATAAGLLAGSVLLLAADARGSRHRASTTSGCRRRGGGAGQALALWPGGPGRLGITIAAARLRGYDRGAAFALGRQVGLPIVAGATALKSYRLLHEGLAPELRTPFATGVVAALASAAAAAPLRRCTMIGAPAAERVLLAALALARLRRPRR